MDGSSTLLLAAAVVSSICSLLVSWRKHQSPFDYLTPEPPVHMIIVPWEFGIDSDIQDEERVLYEEDVTLLKSACTAVLSVCFPEGEGSAVFQVSLGEHGEVHIDLTSMSLVLHDCDTEDEGRKEQKIQMVDALLAAEAIQLVYFGADETMFTFPLLT